MLQCLLSISIQSICAWCLHACNTTLLTRSLFKCLSVLSAAAQYSLLQASRFLVQFAQDKVSTWKNHFHLQWIKASFSTTVFISCVLVNTSHLFRSSGMFSLFHTEKRMIKLDQTYLPGQTDGSQARPAWWRTLHVGKCARTCTPPCLWSAAAPASSGTGSCWGLLLAAFSRCWQTPT